MIKKRSKVTSEFSASSMSDIIFQLLIFFLVSTMFAVEKGLPMALPGKGSQTVKLKRESVLNIQAYSNGTIVIRGTGPVNLGDIKEVVERKLVLEPKLVVVIETHPDAEYGLMIDILDELRLANATRISLRSMKGES
jgi:biopolymer transport protein ExbD